MTATVSTHWKRTECSQRGQRKIDKIKLITHVQKKKIHREKNEIMLKDFNRILYRICLYTYIQNMSSLRSQEVKRIHSWEALNPGDQWGKSRTDDGDCSAEPDGQEFEWTWRKRRRKRRGKGRRERKRCNNNKNRDICAGERGGKKCFSVPLLPYKIYLRANPSKAFHQEDHEARLCEFDLEPQCPIWYR